MALGTVITPSTLNAIEQGLGAAETVQGTVAAVNANSGNVAAQAVTASQGAFALASEFGIDTSSKAVQAVATSLSYLQLGLQFFAAIHAKSMGQTTFQISL